jgi:hypothetical protein
MKTLIAVLALTLSSTSFAQHGGHRWHNGHHHNRHWHSNHNWVVPAIIGGAALYAVTRPEPVVIQSPPVILQPNQVVIDGMVYNKQIMIINGVQTEVFVRTN